MKEINKNEFILTPNLPVYDIDGNKVDIKLTYDSVIQKYTIYKQIDNVYQVIDYVEFENQWYNEGFLSVEYFKLYRPHYTTEIIGGYNAGLISHYKKAVDFLVHSFANKHNIDLTNINHCWVNGDFGGTYDFVEYTVPFKDIVRDLELNTPPNTYNNYRNAIMLGETIEDYIDWFFKK